MNIPIIAKLCIPQFAFIPLLIIPPPRASPWLTYAVYWYEVVIGLRTYTMRFHSRWTRSAVSSSEDGLDMVWLCRINACSMWRRICGDGSVDTRFSKYSNSFLSSAPSTNTTHLPLSRSHESNTIILHISIHYDNLTEIWYNFFNCLQTSIEKYL